MTRDAAHRYEELAGFVAGLVDAGTLDPGDRAPSLRRIAREQRVSLATAIQAYRLLEDRGVLEARPQSGFYVARRTTAGPEQPAASAPARRAREVSVSSLALELLEYAADPRLAPLGCAIPGAEVLRAERLDRCLARAARTRGAEHNVYTAPRGDPALRQELARRALRWGQALAPDDIAITCGCTEALALALKCVTSPGDTVAIESPTYFGLLQVLEAQGLKALELPTDPSTGIDPAALERALDSHPVRACLFASGFSNPLGATMPEAAKRAILALLAERRIDLVEDDIYGDIHFTEERPVPFMALDRTGRTIYCSSFSKTLAPGYRVGWIASRRYMPAILREKFALTLCGPALPQTALAEFLSSGGYDSHLRRIRRTFRDTMERMRQAIAASFPPGTRVSRPAGGFVLWVELPGPVDGRQLLSEALAEGICFAPGEAFSASGRFTNCMRLSCGNPWNERLARDVAALGALAARACGAG